MAYLCLLCRQSGHQTADCPNERKDAVPNIGALSLSSGATAAGGELCQRCKELKILDLLLRADVQDELSGGFEAPIANKQFHRSLGAYRAVVLVDTCPLCRLLFAVFPTEDKMVAEEEPDADYLLLPLRTYNRLGVSLKGLRVSAEDVARRYAVSVSVLAAPLLSRQAVELLAVQEYQFMYATSFGLTSNNATDGSGGGANKTPQKLGLPARVRGVGVDWEVLAGWLRRCDAHHPDCAPNWSDELLITSMIDVETRKVVPTPPQCRYLALSYVWGPVVPEEGALQKGTLPPTIEDAIVATKKLGLRYLWVDAVCIEQRPQTPEQRADKMRQLAIMDRVYAGAYATLTAFYGDSSLFGLRGVSAERGGQLSRAPQAREVVEGYELAAIYPINAAEWEFPTCTHRTRAWTLQEEYLSRRMIFFGRDQVHYRCQWQQLEETVDETLDPGHLLDSLTSERGPTVEYFKALQQHKAAPDADSASPSAGPSARAHRQTAAGFFASAVSDYTARRIAYDSDALNACLGMLNALARTWHLQPFAQGLPLRDFPLSLLWNHKASYSGVRRPKPRRRPAFPSWSYVGWEGAAGYTVIDSILPAEDQTDAELARLKEKSIEHDLAIKFVDAYDDDGDGSHILKLSGCAVTLEIRTAPFSEAYVPGTDTQIGMLTENNERHPNTLPSGVYDFVVVQRMKRDMGNGRWRHVLYLIMLVNGDGGGGGGGGGEGTVPERRTVVQWNVERDFIPTPAYAAMLQKRDDIRIR